ncbi:hypothetical protein HYDPIDRAFT_183588 [Hydnomerulius pinastri MD-312]|uniref:Arf-GAP domain-containing protein n=1 Tax=Hydnomerulius pinastri MD-312 TaxID=994086 RepID=A0A0C9WAK9_9AGAM|nr:hypothetical protein HYDPIDRAFT_183588 [Hydnomerulius pinastri MD-312]
MSRQDKATTDRNAKLLRELVKQPDNKVCADCKRNDPRWASWNLGVYLCIRCSGIHRGMGTHISRVKSIDLDMWTPEQMEAIQKWGNRRANLYWEAHLKSGHVPPDHKMESFIRSKYESRRWAMDGPPPSDPSVLEGSSQSSNGDTAQLVEQPAPTRTTHAPSASLSAPRAASPSVNASGPTRQQQPQSRQLLSSAIAGRANLNTQVPTLASPTSATASAAQPQPQPAPQDDLFSLDFHAPPAAKTSAPPPPVKDVKQDILSLFSSAPAPSPASNADAFGQFASVQTWDSFVPLVQPQTQAQAQPTSMVGSTGAGAWGVSSGWNAPAATTSANNIWGGAAITTNAAPAANQLNAFSTADIWGGSSTSTNSTASSLFASQAPAAPKKDDVFGDLWGDFK